SIGQVASAAGVNASAIRYYEKIDLLVPDERQSGHRRYDPAAVRKLTVIGIAQRAGFTLDEIKLLVTPVEAGSEISERLRNLANKKLPEVEGAIAELHSIHSWLSAATRCDCSDLDVCGLFDQRDQLPMATGAANCC
ncbi:MAG: MerR family transcriptional regulator, partial [Solirubrobacterales bacterium]